VSISAQDSTGMKWARRIIDDACADGECESSGGGV
jgi:hypothetical protein